MTIVLHILYGLIIFVFVVISCFIVYHLKKYSYDKKVSFLTTTLFLLVTGALIAINIITFMRLPLEELIPKGF